MRLTVGERVARVAEKRRVRRTDQNRTGADVGLIRFDALASAEARLTIIAQWQTFLAKFCRHAAAHL